MIVFGDVFAGIGIAAIVTVFCFILVLGTLKLNDFLNDVHSIAENTKK